MVVGRSEEGRGVTKLRALQSSRKNMRGTPTICRATAHKASTMYPFHLLVKQVTV